MEDWKEVFPECVSPSGRLKQGLTKEKKAEIFIYRARCVHGDRYDYSLVDYSKGKGKVKIVCKEHGVFEQIPNDHVKGIGCISCGGAKANTTESFIARAREVHGDRYTYSNSTYVSAHTKVYITCVTHGDFAQTPNRHTRGDGCPLCKGFASNTLYLLNSGGSYYKIGITSDILRRVSTLEAAMNTPLKVIATKKATYEEVTKWERQLHEIYEENPYATECFEGYTEWRIIPDEDIPELLEVYFN